jgi:hypothetical protein
MKVPAIRIEISGEPKVIAGAQDLAILGADLSISASGPNQNIDCANPVFRLLVMGLAIHTPQPRQLTWLNGTQLRPGDRVVMEIVEVDEPTPPEQELSSPSSEQLAAASKRERGGRRRKPV